MRTEAQKEWRRQWKKEHPEAVRAEKKRYRERHKEQIRTYQREWDRRNIIGTRLLGENHLDKTKKFKVTGKRPYPSDCRCELCRAIKVRSLRYHHWDDSDFSKGIWVCMGCHNKVHYYIRLKESQS